MKGKNAKRNLRIRSDEELDCYIIAKRMAQLIHNKSGEHKYPVDELLLFAIEDVKHSIKSLFD